MTFSKSPCAKNKLDYFSMQRVTSQGVWLSLIVYSSTSQKKCLEIPCIVSSFQGNLIWTCATYACWARYISLCSINFICQKSSHRFVLISLSVIEPIRILEIHYIVYLTLYIQSSCHVSCVALWPVYHGMSNLSLVFCWYTCTDSPKALRLMYTAVLRKVVRQNQKA